MYHLPESPRWRKYACQDCGNFFEVFTREPVPLEKRTCYICQKQHSTLKAYANALGVVIKMEEEI